jgi:hypothetical protein
MTDSEDLERNSDEKRSDGERGEGSERDDEQHRDTAEPDEDTGSEQDEASSGSGDDPLSEVEPQRRLGSAALIGRYRPEDERGGAPVPWSWSTLSPAEVDALVDLVDGFVIAYNQVWAVLDADTVPPCWHRHPALAHDLSALAWSYYQAYRDPDATPDLALRFQAHLPGFRDRLDYWLGADPAACRDGRHSRTWRERGAFPRSAPTRESREERDAVILLGAQDFGFPI